MLTYFSFRWLKLFAPTTMTTTRQRRDPHGWHGTRGSLSLLSSARAVPRFFDFAVCVTATPRNQKTNNCRRGRVLFAGKLDSFSLGGTRCRCGGKGGHRGRTRDTHTHSGARARAHGREWEKKRRRKRERERDSAAERHNPTTTEVRLELSAERLIEADVGRLGRTEALADSALLPSLPPYPSYTESLPPPITPRPSFTAATLLPLALPSHKLTGPPSSPRLSSLVLTFGLAFPLFPLSNKLDVVPHRSLPPRLTKVSDTPVTYRNLLVILNSWTTACSTIIPCTRIR